MLMMYADCDASCLHVWSTSVSSVFAQAQMAEKFFSAARNCTIYLAQMDTVGLNSYNWKDIHSL